MNQPEPPPQTTPPTLDSTGLELVIRSEALPKDVLRMRERVYRDETRLLADADLISKDDEVGTHICLYYQGTLVGAALGVPVEKSSFPTRAGVPADQLNGAYYATRVMIAPEFRRGGL